MIEINKEYFIEHDRLQYMIKKVQKSKETGEPYNTVEGYFTSLWPCIDLARERVRNKEMKSVLSRIGNLVSNARPGKPKDLPDGFRVNPQPDGTVGIIETKPNKKDVMTDYPLEIYALDSDKGIGRIIFDFWFKAQPINTLNELEEALLEWGQR